MRQPKYQNLFSKRSDDDELMRDIDLGLRNNNIMIREHTGDEDLRIGSTQRPYKHTDAEEQDSFDSRKDTLREDSVSLLNHFFEIIVAKLDNDGEYFCLFLTE